MTTVSGTQGSTSATTGMASVSGSISETQDRFLKLLVAQLQNQDPMNPMDNAQMTSQLAQMSTVEGINNLNANFESLMTSMQSNQGLQAASMIGRSVMVEGKTLENTGDGEGVQGAVNLAGSVDKLVVTIKDADGNVVDSLDLGPHTAGFLRFEWDGLNGEGEPAAAGKYSYSVSASAGADKVATTTYAAGKVSGVFLADTGVQLDVEGMGSYSFSEVRQIL